MLIKMLTTRLSRSKKCLQPNDKTLAIIHLDFVTKPVKVVPRSSKA